MSYRTVKGKIHDIVQGESLGSLEVTFELKDSQGDFTTLEQYPQQIATVLTDDQGDFSVSLWANEEGLGDSLYQCKFLRTFFDFYLPPGVGNIELSALRLAGTGTPIAPIPPADDPRNWERLAIATDNQGIFAVAIAPTKPQNSQVYLNGVKAVYSVDYNINGMIINWFGQPAIATTDYLEIYFT